MSTAVDPILSSLNDQLLRFVEDQLSNNDLADDEDLHALFVTNGLTETQATQALLYRIYYWEILYPEGLTPIRTGDRAIGFNPQRKQFEIIEQ